MRIKDSCFPGCSESGRKRLKQVLAVCLVIALQGALVNVHAAEEEKFRYDFYGFVMMDAIYDFDRMDPDWDDVLRPSRIPVTCPGDPGCGDDGEMIFSVRRTRAGVDAFVPTGLGELKAKIEMELMGVGDDAGKTTPRLRHAWAEIGPLGAGQTWSTFMDPDVFPNSIEYWGPPGMIFFRNIQVQWSPIRRDGHWLAIALEAPGSAIDTGKADNTDSELGLTGRTRYPDLTAHWSTERDWGHIQIAAILRSVGYESTTSPDGEPSGDEIGWGVNLSGILKVGTYGELLAQLVYGEAIANYFNDGGVDLSLDASLNPETLPSLGWLVFYNHYWSEKWSTAFGGSMADQDNGDGQTGSAFSRSQYGLINLLYYPTNNIMVGGELQYGERELNDGRKADDTRVQVSFKFTF